MIIIIIKPETEWPEAKARMREAMSGRRRRGRATLLGIRPGVHQIPDEQWPRYEKLVGTGYIDAAVASGMMAVHPDSFLDDHIEKVKAASAKKSKKSKPKGESKKNARKES